MLRVPMNDEEWKKFFERPIVGIGGDQGFLRLLHGRLTERDRIQKIFIWDGEREVLKTLRYAYDYKKGGYQDRFKAMLEAAKRFEKPSNDLDDDLPF